ncbi:MAG: hypothetical protein IE909_05870 [Campylobacterales bacterium]|nr:hypothetical protein [Campylobacterales bacterium]
MDIVLVFLVLAIVGTIAALFKVNGATSDKSSALSRQQLEEKYTQELLSILKKYQDDPQEQLYQKKIFLQQLNSTLARNIFFSADEAKEFIQKLVAL